LKPIALKKLKKYLTSKGCYCKRVKSSHEIWDKKDNSLDRPIILDNNYPDVPLLHMQTNLRTLGISFKDFENEIKNF
jgi:hypothetical protein